MPLTTTVTMGDHTYLLSSTGECKHCHDKAHEKDIVTCMACEKSFHAVCKIYEKATAICVKSFFPMYLTAPSGFNWRCDVCLTKDEMNNVATVNEKLNHLSGKVDSLSDLVQSLVNLVTNKSVVNLEEIKQNISEEVNTKISTEFEKMKSSITEEITSLKSTEPRASIDPTPLQSTVWDRGEKVKEIRTSLLIKHNAASGTSLDIDKLEETAIQNGIPVNSVHVTESGDTFVNLPDKASRDKLQPLIRDSAPTNEVVTLQSKLPTIALLGVTCEYTKTQITNMILKQNEVIRVLVEDGSHLSVLYTKAPSTDKIYHQVVLRVSPDIRRAISNHDHTLHMGKLVHRVVDRFYVRRCNTCQNYGHHHERCPTPRQPVCGYCSEKSHMSNACPIKSGPKTAFSCHNCKSKDLAYNGHSTFWHNCPTYKEQQKKLERCIDYDYSN